MAATADEVSGGRLILGLGAGWHDAEYDTFGFPKDRRVDRFEEALEIVPLVRGETVTFDGRYYEARDAMLEPAPSAGSPCWWRPSARGCSAHRTVRGRMEHRVVRRAGRTAPRAARAPRCRHRGGGRDPATLERTVGIEVRDPEHVGMADDDGEDRSFRGSVDELAEAIDGVRGLGIGHLIVILQPMTEASLERLSLALSRRR